MKQKRNYLIIVIAILFNATTSFASDKPAMAIPVEVVTAKETVNAQVITATGDLLSDKSVSIANEIPGKIKEIFFVEGKQVVKGAPLINLDDVSLLNEVKIAEANYKLSQLNEKRIEELAKRSVSTPQQRDEAVSNLLKAEASLALAKDKLSKAHIVAPFSGFIGLSQIAVGEYVEIGKNLVDLDDIDNLKVIFYISDVYNNIVKIGDKVKITTESVKGQEFLGEVYAIAAKIDNNSHSLAVKAKIDNKEHKLKPGLFVKAFISSGSTNSIMVPEQAVIKTEAGDVVYIVKSGKNKITPVKVGDRHNGKIEIISGIDKDEQVIVSGQFKLGDGMPVKPITVKE